MFLFPDFWQFGTYFMRLSHALALLYHNLKLFRLQLATNILLTVRLYHTVFVT